MKLIKFNKIKKSLTISFLLLVLTGCSANYRITVNKDNIEENIYLNTNEQTFSKLDEEPDKLESVVREMVAFEKNNENFELNFKNFNTTAGYEYTTKFKPKSMSWPTIANECYNNINIDKDDSTLTITTSNEFLCYEKYTYLKDVKITLNTDLKVESHNADSAKDNTYTWNISKQNSVFKPLEITFKLNTRVIKKNEFPYMIVLSGLGIALIIGSVIFFKSRGQNNKF